MDHLRHSHDVINFKAAPQLCSGSHAADVGDANGNGDRRLDMTGELVVLMEGVHEYPRQVKEEQRRSCR